MIDEKMLIDRLINDDGIEFVVPLKDMTPEEVCKTAHTIIVEMKKGFINLINAQPKILFSVDLFQREEGWIPANEPPEEYRDKSGELIPFLVCEKGTEYPFRAMYDGKRWGDGFFAIHVTHWMPLPEPPKEGEG